MANKCSIAFDINNGKKHSKLVSKFGAKTVTNTAKVNVDLSSFSYKAEVATQGAILTSMASKTHMEFISNYLLTNNGGIGINPTFTSEQIDQVAKVLNIDSSSFTGLNSFFASKGAIINPLTSNSGSVVLEINEDDPTPVTKGRNFIRFRYTDTFAFKKMAKSVVVKGDMSEAQYENRLIEETDKLMTAAIVSALYRGFDVLLPSTNVDGEITKKAARIFNTYFNNNGRKLHFASKYRSTPAEGKFSVIKISDYNKYIAAVDKTHKTSDRIVRSIVGVDMIDSTLTETERLRAQRFRRASQKSKIFVANSILNVFKGFIPNLESEFLSAFEISDRYGPIFKDKPGFIVDNRIIINLDRFDISTVFHEFGHYYMRWVSQYNKEVYDVLLKKIGEEYPMAVLEYKKIYNASDIKFSDNDILEEVFVDKLGIKASKDLLKILPEADLKNNSLHATNNLVSKVISMPLNELSRLPAVGPLGVRSTRIDGSIEHFGNFFTGSVDSKQTTFEINGKKVVADWPIKVGPYKELSKAKLKKDPRKRIANINEAVSLYRNFLLGYVTTDEIAAKYTLTKNQIEVLQKQRNWIVNELTTRVFENKDIIYHTQKLSYTSHADVLVELITAHSIETEATEETYMLTSHSDDVSNLFKGERIRSKTEAPTKNPKTLKDLEKGATAIIRNEEGDDKYIYLKGSIDTEKLTSDSKKGTRKKGKKYHKIDIVGAYYYHPDIKDSVGEDGADIIVVDTIEDAQKQFDAYKKAGADSFTHIEFNSEATLLPVLQVKQKADKNAVSKASVANKFIGHAPVKKESSTGFYASQFSGDVVNSGEYSKGDVVFVSVMGKRGSKAVRDIQHKLTVDETILAIEAGAVILTDTEAYIHKGAYKGSDGEWVNVSLPYSSTVNRFEDTYGLYNIGEKKLYNALKEKGYHYSELVDDGVSVGVWTKGKTETKQRKSTANKEGAKLAKYRELSEIKEVNAKNVVLLLKYGGEDSFAVINGAVTDRKYLPLAIVEAGESIEDAAIRTAKESGFSLNTSFKTIASKNNEGVDTVYLEAELAGHTEKNGNKKVSFENLNEGNVMKWEEDLLNGYYKTKALEKSQEKIFNYKGTTINTPHILGFEQTEALKQSIDYLTENPRGLKTFTINGAAGTGKTTIIGLVYKWFSASNKRQQFLFSTPTHSANRTLALANIENGYKTFPSTLSSVVAKADVYPEITRTLKYMLSDDFKGTFIVDEASMVSPVTAIFLKGISSEEGLSVKELRAFSRGAGEIFIERINGVETSVFQTNKDYKGSFNVIFLGDMEQLPTVKGFKDADDKAFKQVSSVFDPKEGYTLTEVKRTKPNTLLNVLTKTRTSRGGIIYDVEGGDESYGVVSMGEFDKQLMADMDTDLENTYLIAYTKNITKRENKKIKESLTGTVFLKEGDKIIGYQGAGNKKISSNTIANSIPYVLDSFEIEKTENGITGINLKSSSSSLWELVNRGVEGLEHKSKVLYIPLTHTDSIQVPEIGTNEMTANILGLNALLSDKALDIRNAYPNNYADAVKNFKDVFLGIELGGDYIFDVDKGSLVQYTGDSTQYSRYARMYGKDKMKAFIIEKGIDYGYAVNTHKAQGITIKNTYINGESLNYARHTPILDHRGVVFNTEKNAIIYTSISRASKKARISNYKAYAVDIEAADLRTDIESQKNILGGIEESINTFAEKFLRSLTGVATLNLSDTDFSVDSTIKDIFNIASKHSKENSSLFKDASYDAFDNLENFFIGTYSLKDIGNSLSARGLIRVNNKGNLILLDELGNFLDGDGNVTNLPTDIKYDDPKSVQLISGYLNKYQALAKVMFSMDMTPMSVENKLRDSFAGIEFSDADETHYEQDGVLMERTTSFITSQFSSEYDQEKSISLSIYKTKKKEFIRIYREDKELSEEEIEAKAASSAIDYVVDKGTQFLDDKRRLESLYEFKREEGTFIHAIAELYVATLNYTTKINYGHGENKGLNYYADHVHDAIVLQDREAFRAYYKKYFFSKIKDKTTTEYKNFKAAYDFMDKHLTTDKLQNTDRFLKQLREVFKEKIFNNPNITGPITLIPELKMGSKTLGVAGTIDLVILDGNGNAHIFDYKTKERGQEKRRQWNYPNGIKMVNEMASFPDNAMTKAGVQTSMYKIFLAEAGIKTISTNVFYIENKLETRVNGDTIINDEVLSDTILGKKLEFKYEPVKITLEKMLDFSSHILSNAEKKGKISSSIENNTGSLSIMNITTKAAAGMDIDVIGDVDQIALDIYERAVNKKGTKDSLTDIYNKLGLGGKKGSKGLVIRLPGNIPTSLPTGLSRSASIEEIKKLILGRKGLGSIEGKFEEIFYSLNRDKRGIEERVGSIQQDATIRGMLVGVDSNTHELTKFSSDINFGLEFTGNFMVTNKLTGETRFIVLNHDEPRGLNFGKGRWTVFGNYMSDRAAKSKFKDLKLNANTHDMRIIKAGLMLLKMKADKPEFKISMMVSNDNMSSKLPVYHDIDTVLKAARVMLNAMHDSGEVLPADMEKIRTTPSLFKAINYQVDPVEKLADYIAMVTDSSYSGTTYFSSEAGERTMRNMNEIVTNFDPHNDYSRLQVAIHKFRDTLDRRLDTLQAKKNSDIWKITDDVIHYLNGFNQMIDPKNTTFKNNFFFTPSKSSNYFQSSLNRKITSGNVAIRADYIDYKKEFNNKIRAVAKANGYNISALSSSLWKQSRKEVFKNLYVDPTNSNRDTAYTLKSPNHKSLNSAEKAFLRFYYDSLQKFTDKSVFTKKVIKYGWMPLMARNNSSVSLADDPYKTATLNIKNIFKSKPSKQVDDATAIDEEFSTVNRFEGQIPRKDDSIDDNFTYERRRKLGLDKYGNELPDAADLDSLEDDLELVLDSFVLSSLDTVHYRDVTAFGRSLLYNVLRHEDRTSRSYANLIETLMLIQRRVIGHQTTEGEGSILFNTMNRGVTLATVAGTIPQALLETFTNPLITTSNYLADKLYEVLFKGSRDFSSASYSKAVSIVWGNYGKTKDLINAIDAFYGFSNSDTAALKKTMNVLRKHSLFDTDKLMYVNQLMMSNWQKITMVSYMIEDGSFNAHSLDAEGNLVYEQARDLRFKIFKGDSESVKADKKAKLLATKEQLVKEPRGLTNAPGEDTFDEKKLARGYTMFDVNRIKENIVEVYAGIDDSAKTLSSYFTWMGLLTKMRVWIFPKMSRYFSKPKTAEENYYAARLVKSEQNDDEGRPVYEWVGEESEGILYSVVAIASEINEMKGEFFKKGHKMTDIQHRNLSKLLSDSMVALTTAAAAAGLFALLDDEQQKDPMVQLIYARINMAIGDVMFLKALAEITGGRGSLFISFSVLGRIGTNMGNAAITTTSYLSGADVEASEVAAAYNDIARSSFGFYRTIETIATGRVK